MMYGYFPNLPGIRADNGGCAMLNPGWSHPRRNLSSSVLILGRKNAVSVHVAGRTVEIRPDRLCILPAGVEHRGLQPLNRAASYYWMHFTAPLPPQVMEPEEAATILNNQDVLRQRLGNAALLRQELDLENPEAFHRLFHDLLYEQERPSYSPWKFQFAFKSMLIMATEATIKAHGETREVPPSSSLVYAILSDIAENLTDPNLCIKSIADNLDHNPDYLGRQFKRVMGLSIGDFILQRRVKLAVGLLQDSHDSVADIGLRCGFGSVRHFLRQFKAERGVSPGELRVVYRLMHINNQ